MKDYIFINQVTPSPAIIVKAGDVSEATNLLKNIVSNWQDYKWSRQQSKISGDLL